MLNVYYRFIYDRRVWCKCKILNTGKYNRRCYKIRSPVHYKCSLLYNCKCSIAHLMYFHVEMYTTPAAANCEWKGGKSVHQGFVARACTASVCASQRVCVQVHSTAWYCISFSLLSSRESLWDTCNVSHRTQGMCVYDNAYLTSFHWLLEFWCTSIIHMLSGILQHSLHWTWEYTALVALTITYTCM